ncbi:MAG: dihydroorotase [Cyanobacteriota bacterium]|nr:dihydroorotase [Cyanobacteriota bacterium]
MVGSSTLWRGLRLLDPLNDLDQEGDLWIEQGVIRYVGKAVERIPAATTVVEARGWVAGPGLIDLYAQSGEPGFEQRETLASLAAAARAGGYTQVALLPSTHPVLDQREQLDRYPQKVGDPHWLPLMALTLGGQGEQLSELGSLATSPGVAFCQDNPGLSLVLLQRVLEYLQPFQKPLLIWAWDPRLAAGGGLFEGDWALRLGVKGIPATAETTQVASVLELLRRIPTPIHLMRISQSRSLELIAQAQQAGIPVTASTSWMHLLHSEADIWDHHYHPALRVQPPLTSLPQQQALISGIAQGILTAIASDHHPYTFEEKMLAFADAPPGAIGLELVLPLLWNHLVTRQQLTPLQLWKALSVGSATCLGLPPPHLQVDTPANLVLFDPEYAWQLTPETLHSRSQATCWLHQSMRGRVMGAWIDGVWGDPYGDERG